VKLRGEIKAWSEDLTWHLEVGGRAERGGNGRPVGEEGDGANRRAPHGSDVRERRCLCQSVQSPREYTFWQIRQCGLGQVGRARARWHVGEAAESDKFSGRIGQVFRSAESDKF
jgi:hypothetical protein